MIRTKRQSIERLRTLSRGELHNLSSGFELEDKQPKEYLFIKGLMLMATLTLVIILASWVVNGKPY